MDSLGAMPRTALYASLALATTAGCGRSDIYIGLVPPTQASTGGGTTGRSTASAGGTSGGLTITVSTVAGDGTYGDQDGSGGRDGTAEFEMPRGLRFDTAGNLFVADATSSRIRRIDLEGNVTSWAGNGSYGLVNGSDDMAEFADPCDLAVAPSGVIFVADTYNSVVRQIDVAGNVTTLDLTGGDVSELVDPAAIALGSTGNLYLADTGNQRIWLISVSGQPSILAGTTTAGFADGNGFMAQFDQPSGLAVGLSGNVYVGDTLNNRIRKIDLNDDVTTVAGNGHAGYADGPAGTAEFNQPTGLAVDHQGNIIVADSYNNRIRRIDLSGNVTTIAGNGIPGNDDGSGGADGPAEFNHPWGVAVDATGNIYVGGNLDYRVRKIAFQ